jgi:son of sevenless-like protein
LTKDEFSEWKVEKLDKVRIRIASVLKYWIETFWHFDFETDKSMQKQVDEAIQMMNKIQGGITYANVVNRALNKAKDESSNLIITTPKYPAIEKPPVRKTLFGKQEAPKNRILVWPVVEIARQMTLIEFTNFILIEPKECLNQSWSKGQRETKAPGICAMVARFNQLSMWVGSTIVSYPDIEERAQIIEKFIDIADQLWQLNNFNGVFTICSGLGLSSIFRLKKTWPMVSEAHLAKFETLKKSISPDSSFAAIRSRIKNVKPPAIPYIGIYLTDLTFIEDGNPKYVNERINFVKCKCFAGVIRDLQTYQNTKYEFAKATELHEMLLTMIPLNDDQMYKLSLEIEPKERKSVKKE